MIIDYRRKKNSDFFTAYLWNALRNPAWNLHTVFNLSERVREETIMKLKYVNEKGEYQHNKGEYLSLKHSNIGRKFFKFTLERKKYWRYTYADNIFGETWVELQIGYTGRPTFRFKYKNKIKVYEL